ncbi:MAG TPA: FAD:protein FMN transferase [Streptosporangiaceae bacterium]|nr:FAD:protein FMN transferase [Streptosporangiaceae bacterium]
MSTGTIASSTFGVFGTTAVLVVTSAQAVGEARSVADGLLADVDLACNRFRPDSELSRLNAAGGRSMPVSQTLADLLAAALRAARITGGDVDPTCGSALLALGYDRDFPQVQAAARGAGVAPAAAAVGPVPGWRCVHLDRSSHRVMITGGARLDLGATAKAWAADRCADQIAARLGCGVLVSLGGDVAVAGPPPPGGWRIRVTDDQAAPASVPGQTVSIGSGGLATSSTTIRSWALGHRRVHHIIDPATGGPAVSCWRTVSVAAGTCTDANIASTAAIIRGPAAPGWLHDLGLPARLVRHDGSTVTTAGWPGDGDPGAA